MDITLERYLDTVDKCLKPLPTSERIDIVKEVKSSILEMESEKFSTEQIIERLGNPKELSKAYLGDLLSKESGFSFRRFLTVCSYYSLVGFSGMVVIPTLVMCTFAFILCGVVVPIVGVLKLLEYICDFHFAFIENAGMIINGATVHPVIAFFLEIIIGIMLFMLGKKCWKLLISYCKKVSKTKMELI